MVRERERTIFLMNQRVAVRTVFLWAVLLGCTCRFGVAEKGELRDSIPRAKDFSRIVLSVMRTYPANGTHAYYWPRGSSWAGNTRDLIYRGEVFAKGDPQGRAYCCGLTFEVFFRSYEQWCRLSKRPFRIIDLDATSLRRFRGRWFGSRSNLLCSQSAITEYGIGREVPLSRARPGDFVQFWRHSGSGHSVIFMKWKCDANGKRTGMTYWSTQPSTRGIGQATEMFGGSRGIDPDRIHLARVGR